MLYFALLKIPEEGRMKKILYVAALVLSAAILFSVSLTVESSRASDGAKITIAYSGSVLGYLEPCG